LLERICKTYNFVAVTIAVVVVVVVAAARDAAASLILVSNFRRRFCNFFTLR